MEKVLQEPERPDLEWSAQLSHPERGHVFPRKTGNWSSCAQKISNEGWQVYSADSLMNCLGGKVMKSMMDSSWRHERDAESCRLLLRD